MSVEGCGLNVSNRLPTTCLNDMLPNHIPDSENFHIEEIIAATLNKYEGFFSLFYTFSSYSSLRL